MGEYADMALEESISEFQTWGWRRPRRSVAPGNPIECRCCGHPALYWHQHNGKWLLHHWACVPLDSPPRYILHRCGFPSDGKPKAPAQGMALSENSRSEVEAEGRQSDASMKLKADYDALVDAASAVVWRYSNRPDEIHARALWEPLAVMIGKAIAARATQGDQP